VADLTPRSPEWWVKRLYNELNARQGDMQLFRDLVDDNHAPAKTSEQSEKFARMAGLSTTNLTGLVVEATAQRIKVEGIRFGDNPDSDKDAWRIWQESDFDAGSADAIANALVYGRAPISVDPAGPRLVVEDPRQVVVAYSSDGRRDRLAALKVFTDEWTGAWYATLYLPEAIYRYEDVRQPRYSSTEPLWSPREVGGTPAVSANPLGEVPFFELRNRVVGRTRSEIANLVVPQLRLNQAVFNTDAVAEYGAFRQKWVTGIEVPRDPSTGAPVTPYEAHVAKLFVGEEGAQFGDFNPTDLSGYLDLGRSIAEHMCRIAFIPASYVLNVNNMGAEMLALHVAGLIAKCKHRTLGYEPGFEGAMRLAFKALNDPRANEMSAEIQWASMETRSVAQDADAAVKLTQGDNPVITPQTAQEKYLGMSQTERDRDDAYRAEGTATSNLDAVLQAAQATPLP
jgi:hypothetical protein